MIVPTVRKIHRCDRCGETPEKVSILGNGYRLCASCVRILVRLATV